MPWLANNLKGMGALTLCALAYSPRVFGGCEQFPGLEADLLPLRQIEHQTRPDESISEILFRYGIGTHGSPYNLYGQNGWIARQKHWHPRVKDWENLGTADHLDLLIPCDSPYALAAANWPSLVRVPFGMLVTAGPLGEGPPTTYVLHALSAGDSLSEVLYRRGVGTPGAQYNLMGRQGYIAKVQALNPEVTDWTNLRVGRWLTLAWPTAAWRQDAEPAIAPPPPPPPVVAPADVNKDEVASLMQRPRSEIEQLPTEALAQRLDEDAIAKMDQETVDKIPPAVVEEKAWEMSLFDLGAPGMDQLFAKLNLRTPAGYAGLRYGHSLSAANEPLVSKVQQVSLLVEVRDGPLDGLRFIWDWVPVVHDRAYGLDLSLGWSKTLLGWAYAFDLPAVADQIHLIPRLGRYSFSGRLPVPGKSGAPIVSDVSIGSAFSAGLEADVEWSAFFYVLRLWTSRDSSALLAKTLHSNSATSQRFGADLWLKTGAVHLLGARLNPAFLVFGAYESITVQDHHPQAAAGDISLSVLLGGVGLSLAW